MKNKKNRLQKKGNIEITPAAEDAAEKEGRISRGDVMQMRRMQGKDGKMPLCLPLAVLLVIVFFGSFWFILAPDSVSFTYTPAYIATYVSQNIRSFFSWIIGNGAANAIDLKFRQYVIITLVGATLGGAGAMYKMIFRNTLAAPTTMGVQEGGILGNLLFLSIFGSALTVETSLLSGQGAAGRLLELDFFARYGQRLFIFGGCFFGVACVALIATTAGRHRLSSAALILAGTVVNGAISGINGAVQYEITMNSGDDDLIQILMSMTLGTFEHSYVKSQFFIMLIVLLPCIALMGVLAGKMNIYALGDEEAKTLGLNVRAFQAFVIVLGAFMTAVTMVYCGHIAFIGFIVPQIAGRFAGTDFKKLFPASVLLGGTVMLLVYDVAKVIGMRDGLSMITTWIGGVMLIYALMHGRGEQHETVA